MIYVMDASALLALLRQEAGWQDVETLLSDAGNTCYAHAVNLCEVFHDFHRGAGEATAQNVLQDLLAAELVLREDMEPAFWQEAGRHKSQFRRLSLADCFCIPLTRRLAGTLVTGDHHEFDRIAPTGLCPIRFIR